MTRLEHLFPTLAAQLRRSTTEKQRAAALAACEFSLAKVGVNDPAIAKLLHRLQRGDMPTAEDASHIDSLAVRLDDEYLNLQEAAKPGNASDKTYLHRFAQARAVAGLAFLCNTERPEATEEAIYEAAAAAADQEQFIAFVQAALN